MSIPMVKIFRKLSEMKNNWKQLLEENLNPDHVPTYEQELAAALWEAYAGFHDKTQPRFGRKLRCHPENVERIADHFRREGFSAEAWVDEASETPSAVVELYW